MRSFLAAVAVLIATVAGVVACAAYVAHEAVLDTSRSGQVLSSALKQKDLRDQVLSTALPGYGRLPSSYRSLVDRAAGSPEVTRALSKVRIDPNGTVHVGRVRQQVVQSLRDHGQPLLAGEVASAGGQTTFKVPTNVMGHFREARRSAWLVATRAALAAVVLFVLALLVARNRRAALGAIGVALLVCFGATLALYAVLPDAASRLSGNPWVQAAASAGGASRGTVVSLLLPVAIAGVVAVLASLVMPRSSRR